MRSVFLTQQLHIKNLFIFLILFFISSLVYASRDDSSFPKTGNFALSSSQQPGPLVGFGQNIVDKNQKIFFLLADDFKNSGSQFIDIAPSFLYGITDNLSVYFNMPIAADYRSGSQHAAGLEDSSVQFEYAFYNKQNNQFVDQATVVTNMTFPTGSSKKDPPTGFGSPSFFLGATFNRMYTNWFGFTSYGTVLTTSRNNTQFGNQFLYQAGFGRNIFSIEDKWIFAWMVEVDGQYSEKNRMNGIIDPNSGGNMITTTPSLWISSQHLIIQVGVGIPIAQHLFGNQPRNNYSLISSVGFTF
ncbi:MAG: hypothetical protein JSS53_00290 [Proteobacteria bacterium]|nr:hypothetical protein [Pseudomonadota bacterium]